MANRYVIHLGSVLFLHIILLFSGWHLIENSGYAEKTSHRVILMNVADQPVTAPKPRPRKKVSADAKTAEVPAANQTSQTPPSAENQLMKAELKEIYKGELRTRIEQNKFYPSISKRLGQTGIVVIAFTLLEDGNIINIRIDTPSPFERLNQAGLEAVKKVQRFKPIPPELSLREMDLKVPVNFVTI